MANAPIVPLASELLGQMRSLNALQNGATGRPSGATGVFAAQPFATAKFNRWQPDRKHEFENTMARMFIKVPTDLYKKFLASLQDAETRRIAEVLAGDDVKQGGHGYIDWLLQTANHQLNEKFQVAEVLSDNYVAFFFGQEAPIWQYQGTLLNTYQDDWTMRMFRIFQDLGRGTQLARRGFTLRLKYDSMVVSGAMVNFNWSLHAGRETYSPFQFSFLVQSVQILYGSISPPTKFNRQSSFTPQGFQLIGAGLDDEGASQTYMGSPPGAPGGVTEEEKAGIQSEMGQSVDPAGNKYPTSQLPAEDDWI